MNNKIERYKSPDNQIEVMVQFEKDTVWFNRQQLVVLFHRDIKTIVKHINNVFVEGELEESRTVVKFTAVQKEGSGTVESDKEY